MNETRNHYDRIRRQIRAELKRGQKALTVDGVYLCSDIPYLAWHYEADRRYRRGERQLCCSVCELWFFPKWKDDVRDHKRRCAAFAAFRAVK